MVESLSCEKILLVLDSNLEMGENLASNKLIGKLLSDKITLTMGS